MSAKGYLINFQIKDLSFSKQNKIFSKILNELDYDERQSLSVTLTDPIGGKHFIWERSGIDPQGVKCEKCPALTCEDCVIFLMREKELKKNESKT